MSNGTVEPGIVVEHREHLWWLLAEAAQLEHGILCQYEPARPVLAAFTGQPFDVAEPQSLITDPTTRGMADMFNLGYEVLLQTLTRCSGLAEGHRAAPEITAAAQAARGRAARPPPAREAASRLTRPVSRSRGRRRRR
jgi:hypothetical protein